MKIQLNKKELQVELNCIIQFFHIRSRLYMGSIPPGNIPDKIYYGYEFSHTLEAQIRGQLKNGLAMIDFYESCDKRNRLSQYGNDYIATLCIKL